MLQALRRRVWASPSKPPTDPWPVFTGTTARYALEWGVGLSLSLHAIILSVHFVMPDVSKFKRQDKGLEVVLVNSRHAQRPDKVDVLAQTHLDAGGTGDKSGRMATPLPPQERSRVGDGLVEAQRRSEQQQAPQMQIMAGTKGKPIQVDAQQVNPTESPNPVSGYDLLDSSAAVATCFAISSSGRAGATYTALENSSLVVTAAMAPMVTQESGHAVSGGHGGVPPVGYGERSSRG